MEFSDITCPVCGLACDDLQVSVSETGAQVQGTTCPSNKRYFSTAWPEKPETITPRIDGERVTLDAAIGHATSLLGNARAPVVSGLMTDVQGTRAALALADQFGACIDHCSSDDLNRRTGAGHDLPL